MVSVFFLTILVSLYKKKNEDHLFFIKYVQDEAQYYNIWPQEAYCITQNPGSHETRTIWKKAGVL